MISFAALCETINYVVDNWSVEIIRLLIAMPSSTTGCGRSFLSGICIFSTYLTPTRALTIISPSSQCRGLHDGPSSAGAHGASTFAADDGLPGITTGTVATLGRPRPGCWVKLQPRRSSLHRPPSISWQKSVASPFSVRVPLRWGWCPAGTRWTIHRNMISYSIHRYSNTIGYQHQRWGKRRR